MPIEQQLEKCQKHSNFCHVQTCYSVLIILFISSACEKVTRSIFCTILCMFVRTLQNVNSIRIRLYQASQLSFQSFKHQSRSGTGNSQIRNYKPIGRHIMTDLSISNCQSSLKPRSSHVYCSILTASVQKSRKSQN